jgi:protein SMG6
MVSSLIESLRWTIIIPLPVIMELDGLSANTSQLGEAAQTAMSYISSHIRSHALYLKVQTSKGNNYLTSLTVRTEEVHLESFKYGEEYG